eukprot:5313416-Pyramimonas_sp.AAC.1
MAEFSPMLVDEDLSLREGLNEGALDGLKGDLSANLRLRLVRANVQLLPNASRVSHHEPAPVIEPTPEARERRRSTTSSETCLSFKLDVEALRRGLSDNLILRRRTVGSIHPLLNGETDLLFGNQSAASGHHDGRVGVSVEARVDLDLRLLRPHDAEDVLKLLDPFFQ